MGVREVIEDSISWVGPDYKAITDSVLEGLARSGYEVRNVEEDLLAQFNREDHT